MSWLDNYPYTNFHELNLDWILTTVRNIYNEWQTVKSDWNTYKDYIDNYFDNLDLSDEVEAVMKKMLLDGSFIAAIQVDMVSAVEQWLANNITPTTPVIDATLSISGAGADSKTTGEHIAYSAGNNILGALFFKIGTATDMTDYLPAHTWGIVSEPVNLPYDVTVWVDDFSGVRIDVFTNIDNTYVSSLTNYKYITIPANTDFRLVIRSSSSTEWNSTYAFSDIFNDFRYQASHAAINYSIPEIERDYQIKTRLFKETYNVIDYYRTYIRGQMDNGSVQRAIHTDYLPISDFGGETTIYFSGVSPSQTVYSFLIYFYDNDKVQTGVAQTATSLYSTTRNTTITIPNDAAYYVYEFRKQSGLLEPKELYEKENYLYLGIYQHLNFDDDIRKYEIYDYNTLFETYYTGETIFTLPTRYINNTGTLSTNAIYRCTPFIKVSAGDAFIYDLCSRTSNSYVVAFYNTPSLNDFDSQHSVAGVSVLNQQTGIWTAPSAGYVRFCSLDEYNETYIKKISKYFNRYNALPASIPDYWANEMNTFLDECLTRKLATGNGTEFFWITDTHYSRAIHNSPALINYAMPKLENHTLIHGGDYIGTNRTGDKPAAYSEFYNFINNFDNAKIITTFGNHDTNTVGNSDAASYFTLQEEYNACYKMMELEGIDTNQDTACYSVELSSDIRLVVARYYYGAFIVNDLLDRIDDEIDKADALNQKIIFCTHAYWEDWTDANDPPNTSAGGEMIMRHLLYKKDGGSKIILWMAGHLHADYSEILSHQDYTSTLRIVVTQCDCQGRSTYIGSADMVKGTDSEQAFDYVIVDTDNNEVTYIRCGAIASGNTRTRTYTLP